MKLKENLLSFLTNVLEELRYHPLFSPYLKTSHENPPQHYLHQCETIIRLILRKPIRVLIGDEIGLGKTITALAVAKYLENIARIKRILIVVPRVLVLQWRKELTRIGIPALKIKHLEKDTFEFYKQHGFPEGYYIASMDLLKREVHVSEIVKVEWDLIIVDEVHKFGYKTQRFLNIGKTLVESNPSRNVIFLSATPHRGDPKDYIERFQLLDPYLVKDWKNLDRREFYDVTHGALLFRRTKEEVNNVYEEEKIFTDAKFYAGLIAGREEEKQFVKELVKFLRTKLIEFAYERRIIDEKAIPLLIILIFKRATSSPYSAMTTLQRLFIKRAGADFPTDDLIESVESFLGSGYEDFEYEKEPDEVFYEFLEKTAHLLNDTDIQKLRELREMAASIIDRGDTKLNATISLLEDVMDEPNSKVIVFTEYKDTLHYIIEKLKVKHPEWERHILALSSEETSDEKKFDEIRTAFEKNPRARILIATDVIAEGVNLQVANILINYEIPWSLIKLEQRIGRIWRLGQKKDVEIYTLFMDNVADKAALNSMYQKLFNLQRAELQVRPITGQEVLFYCAGTENITELPPSMLLTKEANKKKFVKVTEATSIKAYLEKDEEGLRELVNSIIAAKRELERELNAKGVLYKPRSRKEIEDTIKLTGFVNHKEIYRDLKNLLKASASILGLHISEERNSIKIQRGDEIPAYINNLDGFYAYLTSESSSKEPYHIIAKGDKDEKITLIPVTISDQRDNAHLYRELIGLNNVSNEIIRGSALLNIISQAISNSLYIGKSPVNFNDTTSPISIKNIQIIDEMKKNTSDILSIVDTYIFRLKDLRLRDYEKTWIRKHDLSVKTSTPVGSIHFMKFSSSPPNIPEEVKKEIEQKAIEIVVNIERAEGFSPSLMPVTEHYDIRSVNISTGEIKFIEVKGHSGMEIYAELTEEEVKVAEREKERYWLYIVYNICSGQPEYVRFQNPLETMRFKVIEKVQRYLFTPS